MQIIHQDKQQKQNKIINKSNRLLNEMRKI